MNSQYGFLGAELGFLPCKPAAAAVTATGRNMILATKAFVEDRYGCTVIYGDTDSVFVKLADSNLTKAEIFELGAEMATRATELFPRPVNLEFEKVLSPRCLHRSGNPLMRPTAKLLPALRLALRLLGILGPCEVVR